MFGTFEKASVIEMYWMTGGIEEGEAGEAICQVVLEFVFYSKWDESHLKA